MSLLSTPNKTRRVKPIPARSQAQQTQHLCPMCNHILCIVPEQEIASCRRGHVFTYPAMVFKGRV